MRPNDAFQHLRDLVAPESPTAQPVGQPAVTVQGGYGTVPGAKHLVNPNVPVPIQKITHRDAQNIVTAELLAACRSLMESTTELTGQIRRQGAKNGVIGLELISFADSSGVEVSRPITIGSMIIHNVGSSSVIVQVGAGAASSAPNKGQGMHSVPPGAFIPIPVGQRGLVLYGNAGQQANIQLFTGLQAYGVGL